MSTAGYDWSTIRKQLAPTPFSALIWATVIFFEILLILAYVQLANAQLLPLHFYPFVWINLAVWAIWRTETPSAPRRTKRIAGAIAAGYFLVLAYFGGLVREGHAFHDHGEVPPELLASGFRVIFELPPGYGPALSYSGMYVTSAVIPHLLIGFIALTYLLYVTILDAGGDASVGLVGLFSCIGCSFPLLFALFSGGATTAVAAFVYSQAYALSTVVFAFTIGVLYWRPFTATTVRSPLVAGGFLLVGLSGAIHLGLGVSGLVSGDRAPILSVLFLAAGLVMFAVVGGYVTGRIARFRAISLGAGLMALVFVLYLDWHLLGALEAILPLDAVGLAHDHHHGHDHNHSILAQFGDLLRDDVTALVAKTAEFLALVFLGTVAIQEWVDISWR